MTQAEFLANITGNPNDFAMAVQALRATGVPFCLAEAYPEVLGLVKPGLIPALDELRQ